MVSIIEWKETTDSLGFATNQEGITTLDRSFRIQFDAPMSDVRRIYADSRFPRPFSKHPKWAGAYATSPSARARYNARVWEINVPYSTALAEEQLDPNPLARPATVNWSSQTEKEPTVRDAEGDYFVNTAGDLMLGETRDKDLWEISLSKNVANIPNWVKGYKSCTNADSVKIDGEQFDVNTLKIARLGIGDYQQENNTRFRILSLTILYDEAGWTVERASRGFNERVIRRITLPGEFFGEDRETLIPIVNANGRRIDEPAFLDQDGKAYRDKHGNVRGLADSSEGLKPNEIIHLKFKGYRRKPFNVLPLK